MRTSTTPPIGEAEGGFETRPYNRRIRARLAVMRQLDLQEHRQSDPHPLSPAERDALAKTLDLTIQPVPGEDAAYHLTPGSTVGAVEIDDLSVLIRPKIGIPQLLSLACYAMSKFKPRPEMFDHPHEYALPDVLALALASAAGRAFSRGLLHGYRTEEEALHTVRGRIRFDEQIRRRFGLPLPVEVRYDDFTDDVLENRLVKAAARRLARMRLRSQETRRALSRTAAILDNVSLVEFPPRAVPEVRFDRLNEHYREVVALARLVLRHTAFESGRGAVRASGFLMNMNDVFQEFVTVALREALGVSERMFRESSIPTLDEKGRVNLEPDLTWWQGGRCVFVGDAKYKKVKIESVPNADLYQLLAYVTALDLPGGLLVYAQDDAEPVIPVIHNVQNSGKRLEVAALDLSGTLDQVLDRVAILAQSVRRLRDQTLQIHPAA